MKEVKFVKNFYKNRDERCFILGNGPSLNKVDLSLLTKHIVVGVNLILYSGFVPDFLCVSDRDMIIDNYKNIINNKMNKGYYLISKTKDSKFNHLLQSHKNVRLIDGFKENKQQRFPYIDPELKKFAITKNGVINDLAIGLAIYLGFEEIFLLGVDGQHGTNTHFYDCEGIENNPLITISKAPIIA